MNNFVLNLSAHVLTVITASHALGQRGLPAVVSGVPRGFDNIRSIDTSGDVNNDGWNDILIVEGYKEVYWGVDFHVLSGRDGSTWLVNGYPPYATTVGDSANGAFIGDVDQDQHDDFAIGSPFWRADEHAASGRVDVFSGRTGSRLTSFQGTRGDVIGLNVAYLGDVNNDGRGDFGFVSRSFREIDSAITVVSGRTLAVISNFSVSGANSIVGLGDITGDQFGEILVGARGLWIMSAVDGQPVWFDQQRAQSHGEWVSAGTDVTGDGVNDFIGHAYQESYVYSGADLSLVAVLPSQEGVVAMGDVNGDGVGDVVTHDLTYAGPDFRPVRRLWWTTRSFYEHKTLRVDDMNRDGISDIIYGGSLFDVIRIVSGAPIGLGFSRTYYLSQTSDPNHWPITEAVELEVLDVQPDTDITLLATSGGLDCTFVPALNGCVNLGRPIVTIGITRSDETGSARWEVKLSDNATPGPRWFQAVEINDPTTDSRLSNVLRIDFIK